MKVDFCFQSLRQTDKSARGASVRRMQEEVWCSSGADVSSNCPHSHRSEVLAERRRTETVIGSERGAVRGAAGWLLHHLSEDTEQRSPQTEETTQELHTLKCSIIVRTLIWTQTSSHPKPKSNPKTGFRLGFGPSVLTKSMIKPEKVLNNY